MLGRRAGNSPLTKSLVRLKPRSIGRQALRASGVIDRDHLVDRCVQRFAFAVILISWRRRGSGDLRNAERVTSPHHNPAGMERAIKSQNNFGWNISKMKSKLRCEHHGLAHGRVGQGFFSAPAHNLQDNQAQSLVATTISAAGAACDWKSSCLIVEFGLTA